MRQVLWFAVFTGMNSGMPLWANQSPEAVNDTVEVEKNGRINIDVLANDRDSDGDSLMTRGVLIEARHSQVLVRNTDGTFHYRPELEFVGRDSFFYAVEDGKGGLSGAMVYIDVVPIYTAIDDTLFHKIGYVSNLPVLRNDHYHPRDSIFVTSVTPGAHTDRVVINTNQTIFYRPVVGFLGMDTLSYAAQNVAGRTFSARVFVEVRLPNGAIDDTARIRQSEGINLWPLQNDRVVPEDTLSLVSFGQSEHSDRVVRNSDGSIHYRSRPDFLGTDRFYYTVTDQLGEVSSAFVYIEVLPLNRAVDDTAFVRESGRVNIDVLANDVFYGNTQPRVISTSQGEHSERVVINSDGTVHYRPLPGFWGEDYFHYAIENGRGAERDTGVVIVRTVALTHILFLQPDTVSAFAGQGIAMDVLANDRHAEGRRMRVASAQAEGEVGVVDGRWVLYRSAVARDLASGTYAVQDDAEGTALGDFAVRVLPGIPPVVARDDTTRVDNREPTYLRVLDNDSPGLRLVAAGSVLRGSAKIDADGQRVQYTPPLDFEGEEAFFYIAEDAAGNRLFARVTLFVAALNRPPVAVPDTVYAVSGRGTIIRVLDNDRDAEGDSLYVADVGHSAHAAEVVLLADDTVFYRAPSGFSGTDEFAYVLRDGTGGSDVAAVVVHVSRPTDGFVAVEDAIVAWEGARINVDVKANDVLTEGASLVAIVPGFFSERVVINSDGTVHYRPGDAFVSEDIFAYTLRDVQGRTASALVRVAAQTVPGDFDGDGQVGFSDFLAFVTAFGARAGDGAFDARMDFSGDGQVGFADFLSFAQVFGRSGQ